MVYAKKWFKNGLHKVMIKNGLYKVMIKNGLHKVTIREWFTQSDGFKNGLQSNDSRMIYIK